MLGVILYILRDYSDEVCSEEIFKMRTYVRKKYPDIRTRNDIIRYVWEFVAKLVDRQDSNPSPEPQKRRAVENKRGKYYEGSSEDEDMERQTKSSKRTKTRR